VRVQEVLLHPKNGSLNVVKQVCSLFDWTQRMVQRANERHIADLFDLDSQNLEVRVVAIQGFYVDVGCVTQRKKVPVDNYILSC
jgi:hypothetical protein